MPSDAVIERLNAIVVLLAGILGALLVGLLYLVDVVGVVVAVAVGSVLAWMIVEQVDVRS